MTQLWNALSNRIREWFDILTGKALKRTEEANLAAHQELRQNLVLDEYGRALRDIDRLMRKSPIK